MNSAHVMLPVTRSVILAFPADARLHLGFDFAHGLIDRAAERVQDAFVAAQGI